MPNNNNLKTISVSGHVKSVVFQNDDNGYHVVKIITKQKKTVTITGVMSNIQEGLFIEATGHEINDPQYGEQVQIVEYVTTLPTNEDAMINFLSSNFTTGIGPVFARKIVDRFGANTFEVIDKTPEKLKNIAGLGKKKYLQLKEKWIEKKIFRDVYFFLHQHSITGSIALKIVSKFGQDTIGVLKENLYVLQTKLAGVGFKRADQLADKLGVDRLSPQRINAGIQHIIQTHAENGHTTIEKKQLLRETQDLLCCTSDIISTGYEQLVSEESVMVKTKTIEGEAHDYVSLSKYYFMEKSIATACMQFLTTQSIKKTGHITSNDVQKCTPFLFSKKQVEAVILALTKKLTVITGGPGTGKSTITKAIVDIAHDRSMKVVCAAPTGKASKRLHSVTKHFSQTIHQLLELDFKTHRFKYNKEFKLDGDLFIIDEMSMVDTYLFYCLTQAIPHNARLILIGDIDQLPSIGPVIYCLIFLTRLFALKYD
jgi:exodeoxyribonuclease V alpha subunit